MHYISGPSYNLTTQSVLLSRHICALVRSRFIENRVITLKGVKAGVWRHIVILDHEIATARNCMGKPAG
jgi:hypothetical protein